jgi:hypothetical protein
MKKDDPTGLRAVNGFSYDAYWRSEQKGRDAKSARPSRRTVRITIAAIVLSALFTYGFLYPILAPATSGQVQAK